uniref:Uncharacterized protein n=2 Tax=Candidatus Bipolaricaulota TaxID=67810 RepID=H5SMH1_9BACT|nr:hypothetical protein HGMM_F50B12C04 [uncultured Acetothermia bacterium]BAL58873.1 hypothetical protein HGMM_OP3C028 [Candidatus Acetothermum autotrophicum]
MRRYFALLVLIALGSLTLLGSAQEPLQTGTCEQIHTDFGTAIVSESTRDFDSVECATLYAIFKSLPVHIRSAVTLIKRLPRDPEAAGRAYGSTIELYDGLNCDTIPNCRDFMVVVFHEIAHVAHFRVFTPQQTQAYRQLYRRSGSEPGNFIGPLLRGRRYATTNEYEDFAELFAAYTEDSNRVVNFVRERLSKNETILFEKLKILFDVLMAQSQPQFVLVYRSEVWDGAMPDGNFRGVVRRALLPRDAQGLPIIPSEPDWEDF